MQCASHRDVILDVSAISHAFSGLRAANNVSFAAPRGHITSLIGPNGAGKTTVFNIITGFLAAQSGNIIFDGKPIENQQPYYIARRGLARTFQAPRVFVGMSVLENVLVGLRQTAEKPYWALVRTPSIRAEQKAALERAEQMLALVGLTDRRHEQAGLLTFGEQQFLSIARTLVSGPTLILLDEPTVGLDELALKKLLNLMKNSH